MTTTFDNSQQNERPDALSRLLAQAYVVNWEAIAYLVIFVVALFTRFYALGDRVMSHDESLHTRYSFNLYQDGNFQHTPLMHGPILFHFTALFYFLFGPNDFTARIYTAVLGVAIVLMPLLFRRWLGRWGALLAAIMLLISPSLMYYNRYIRHDTPAIFFSLVMIYCMFMYLSGPENQRRKAHWLYILSAAMLGNLGSKETAFIYVAIFGIFLLLYWLVRVAQHVWDIPGRTVFYLVMLGILIGGVAALGMYVVLSIVPPEIAFVEGMNSLDAQAFISWTLMVVFSVTLAVAATAFLSFRGARKGFGVAEGFFLVLSSALTCTVLIFFEELSRRSHEVGAETSAPVVPGAEGTEVVGSVINNWPIVAAWVIAIVVIAAFIYTWVIGWWRLMDEKFPEFDLLILIGSLILPWATPAIIFLTGASPTDYSFTGIQRAIIALIPMAAVSITAGVLWNWRRWLISTIIFYALFGFFFTTMFTNLNGLATGLIGSLGYWLEQQEVRRGNQPQYYYLTIIMPVYEFLPAIGSIFAMLAGLGWFWRYRRDQLEDEVVAEEQNAALLAVDAESADDAEFPATVELEQLPEEVEAPVPDQRKEKPGYMHHMPFLVFVSWWAVLNLIGYTLAGEKMPWLATHLTVPLIFLTGWFFGRIFQRIDAGRFRQLGWVYLLLLPLFYMLVVRIVGPFLVGQFPLAGLFSSDGLTTARLQQSGEWLAVLLVAGLVVAALFQIAERTGWQHFRQMVSVSFFAFLAVLTFRAAWMASFVNYDYANEYIVYAHAAPAVKEVLGEIEELSRRTTDGLDLRFIYDNEVSWPYSWYFRDYQNAVFVGASPNAQQVDDALVAVVGEANRGKVEPLLEDRFYRYEHIRLWWPMQDYFNLTPTRVINTFDFSPANTEAAQIRRGLFDIWWARDYTTYGEAIDRNFSLTEWPVSDRMHFYVRKDIASQIWNLGAGDGLVVDPLADQEVNLCNANWQAVGADLVFGQDAEVPVVFNRPTGLSVSDDSRVYVAEEFNHRVSVFDTNGNLLSTIGQPGRAYDTISNEFVGHAESAGMMERPNSVAVGPNGNIFVADTWNYRVQAFTPDGEFLEAFGRRGEYGADAALQPLDGLWGPRDVTVDNEGRVYIADTGNKRIRVYTDEGEHLRDIGSAGSEEGSLNEPAGMTIHPADGRLFIADTWNRRVSVFDLEGNYQYNFRVRAWYDDQGNRPYLALDSERDLLYVTDPDAARVLVYTPEGDCLGSFGQAANSLDAVGNNQFGTASGIAVDPNTGDVFISDNEAGRVVRYAPFQVGIEVQVPVDFGDDLEEIPEEMIEEEDAQPEE